MIVEHFFVWYQKEGVEDFLSWSRRYDHVLFCSNFCVIKIPLQFIFILFFTVLPLQEFVDKFRYNAKRASLVQSRIKAIEREVVVDAVEDEASFTFAFQDRYILISLISLASPSFLHLLLSSYPLSHSLFLPSSLPYAISHSSIFSHFVFYHNKSSQWQIRQASNSNRRSDIWICK